jgi:GntR family transcriptional regulator, transcriptional repressor for pyruvate dehydrogenase complex
MAQQITDQLRRRIVNGDLAPGRRLPSVRRLAAMYGVSAPTVGSAMHALVSLGFVRVSRGVGTYVVSPKDHLSLLSYVWRAATTHELATVRAVTDMHAAPAVAADVRSKPRRRLPRMLNDINFWVHERSVSRLSDPWTFLEADFAFHEAVVGSIRGVEIGPALYAQVTRRLRDPLLAVADVQATDEALDDGHLRLASAIIYGDIGAASRGARWVALRELASLGETLG